jgi:hypothetical protein
MVEVIVSRLDFENIATEEPRIVAFQGTREGAELCPEPTEISPVECHVFSGENNVLGLVYAIEVRGDSELCHGDSEFYAVRTGPVSAVILSNDVTR